MSRDWLDAFDVEDFADLDELDVAVDRVVAELNPRPEPVRPARPGRWLWILGGLAAAAAAGIWVGQQRPTQADHEVVSAASPPSAPAVPLVEYGPMPPIEAPVVVPTEAPRTAVVVAPVEVPPDDAVPPEPLELPPAKSPGLRGDKAQFSIEGDRALLASGLLSYRHDEAHDPGVRSIQVPSLDLELRPVGTVFTVSVRPLVAAMRVEDGAVEMVDGTNSVLATGRRGVELVAIPETDGGHALRILDTTGQNLRMVRQLVPEDCFCDPREVVAAVATLRLSEGGQ